DIIDEHDGYVDKYIGDAVMAFWGGLIPDEQHAAKALRAACAMRNECVIRTAQWKQKYGVDLMARAGRNSRVGVARDMGAQKKYTYTAMGDMVNVASRLESINKAYGTLLIISETTYAKVEEIVDARELDFMTVKGKERPITIYEVLDERGRTDALVKQAAARFGDGLALYRAREFDPAMRSFQDALKIRPDDGPSRMYIARCEHFLEDPPAEKWDGVWHMKEK